MSQFMNLEGQNYGRLTVLAVRKKINRRLWIL